MRASFFTSEAFQKSEDRRGRIALALDECIREKGFAATSLTDIALKAKMSPSHVRYYFQSSEEIIEFYFGAIKDQILIDIKSIPRTSPKQWIEEFTQYFIANPEINKSTVVLMLEIFAVSAHNPKLARIKIAYDNFIRKTFCDFFEWAGTAPGVNVEDASYRLWALEGGMKINSMFQSDFSKKKAGELFKEELYRLAGIGSKKK